MKAETNLEGLLGKSSRLMSNALDLNLKGLGLTSQQWSLMAELSSCHGRNQTELAEALLKNKASVGSLVDYLEKKNCVSRKSSSKDRRQIIVELTPTGRGLFTKSLPLAQQVIGRATGGLDADDLATAQVILGKIIHNLEGTE